jgi:subtilisin family serine protease
MAKGVRSDSESQTRYAPSVRGRWWPGARGFRITLLAALSTMGFGLSPIGANAAPANGATPPFEDGTILAGFQPGVSEDSAKAVEEQEGASEAAVIGAGTHVLKVALGQVEAKKAALKRHAEVRYAEASYFVHADGNPNDPLFSDLWGLNNTGQVIGGTAGKPGADIFGGRSSDAWAVTTGTRDVVIADIDTGIDYTHPDLVGPPGTSNVRTSTAAETYTVGSVVITCPVGSHGVQSETFRHGSGINCLPFDDNGHGTHTAGTIGAIGNNGVGVAGVNWNAQIMALKFLDASGSGTTQDAINVLDVAVQAKARGVNIRATNNSWGGGGYSQALLDEINKAGASDILFVAAAGNSSTNTDVTPQYPSSYNSPYIISVAATTNTDDLAYFSNYGPTTVHLGAPGLDVESTVPNGYAFFSGTSMATPHVTGAAALILAARGYQNVATLKSTILSSVDQIPALAGKTVTGGRLNLCKSAIPCAAPSGTITITPSTQSLTAGSWGGSSTVSHSALLPQMISLSTNSSTGHFSATAPSSGAACSGPSSLPLLVPPVTGGTYYYCDTTAATWTITASAPGFTSGTQTVTVSPAALDHIVVTPPSATVPSGGTQPFSASAYDAFNNLVTVTFSWAVSPNTLGTVSPTSGSSTNFTAATVTTTTTGSVIASAGGKTGSAAVSVVALTAPSNLVAFPQGKHINLGWTATSSGVTYNLYRGTSASGEVLYATGLTSTSVNDFGVTSSVTYYYQVTAVSASGLESARSNEAVATAK